MSRPDASLLFGVLGGGSIDGQSGYLIRKQINQIVGSLNKDRGNGERKIIVSVNEGVSKTAIEGSLNSILGTISKSKSFGVTLGKIDASAAIQSVKTQLQNALNGVSFNPSSGGGRGGGGSVHGGGNRSLSAAMSAQLDPLRSQQAEVRSAMSKARLEALSRGEIDIANRITTLYAKWRAQIAALERAVDLPVDDFLAARDGLVKKGNDLEKIIAGGTEHGTHKGMMAPLDKAVSSLKSRVETALGGKLSDADRTALDGYLKKLIEISGASEKLHANKKISEADAIKARDGYLNETAAIKKQVDAILELAAAKEKADKAGTKSPNKKAVSSVSMLDKNIGGLRREFDTAYRDKYQDMSQSEKESFNAMRGELFLLEDASKGLRSAKGMTNKEILASRDALNKETAALRKNLEAFLGKTKAEQAARGTKDRARDAEVIHKETVAPLNSKVSDVRAKLSSALGQELTADERKNIDAISERFNNLVVSVDKLKNATGQAHSNTKKVVDSLYEEAAAYEKEIDAVLRATEAKKQKEAADKAEAERRSHIIPLDKNISSLGGELDKAYKNKYASLSDAEKAQFNQYLDQYTQLQQRARALRDEKGKTNDETLASRDALNEETAALRRNLDALIGKTEAEKQARSQSEAKRPEDVKKGSYISQAKSAVSSAAKSINSAQMMNATEAEKSALSALSDRIADTRVKLDALNASKEETVAGAKAAAQSITDEANAINGEVAAITASIEERKRASVEAQKTADRELKDATNVAAMQKDAVTLQKRMDMALKNFSAATDTEWYRSIESGRVEIDAMLSGSKDLNRARLDQLISAFNASEAAIRGAGKATKSFTTVMQDGAKKFVSWFGVSQIIMRSVQQIKNMVTAVQDIDAAMTELKKVTNETDAAYAKFLDGATVRARKLGVTIADNVNATADFARLGYNINDATELADAATVYKNVGDGIEDISAASSSLISTMKAFNIEAEGAMSIVDRFNSVGNNFAISSKGVGDALLRSASALAAGNNTLDESIALITAANSVVQDADKVGTTMKTLSMFLRAAKTEAEEAGESTDGMAKSVSSLRKDILALTGGKVDIQIDED